ncbi:MAG TPA: HAD family hydrolase [Candidatus Eremiobacteraceae bacterium]|nr:HAD family hydrolase [Candidatus Eremiobacteraceae bacterium]
MLRDVNAVLFDFDHTLGVDNKLEFTVLREIAAAFCERGPNDDQIQAVLDRFRYMPVKLDQALGDGLRELGCPPERLAAAIAAFRSRALDLAPEYIRPMPGAAAMLTSLQTRGFGLGILSNGWTELQHRKAELIGFPGPVLASEEIGAWKPDVRAFQIALQRFSMNAQTTVYVGDNPRVDVVGAKSAELRAVWADLEDTPYPEGITAPDATITALEQLPALLAT